MVFAFSNTGPALSSITQIYFDDYETDRILGDILYISNGPGTAFFPAGLANNLNLPSANAAIPAFETTSYTVPDAKKLGWLAAFADSPTQPNGVNPGEELEILFDLEDSLTLDGIVAAMLDGDLRIGIHVQGFASGGSETFVTTSPVPEPATMLLLGSGLIGLAAFGRKKLFKKS